MFRYGGIKLFFLKTFFGLILLLCGLFVFISLWTYSPNDPGFGKLQSGNIIKNFFGQPGALISSILIFLFGLYPYVIGLFLTFLGQLFLFGFLVKNIFLKFFLVLFSSVLFNHVLAAFFLDYNSGFVYIVFKNFVIGIFKNYSLGFIDHKLFGFFVSFFSLFFLAVILLYVFNINFMYIKKLRFLEIIIFFLFTKIVRPLIGEAFSLVKKNSNRSSSLKLYKSEPF